MATGNLIKEGHQQFADMMHSDAGQERDGWRDIGPTCGYHGTSKIQRFDENSWLITILA